MSSTQFFFQHLIARGVLLAGLARRKADGSQSWRDYFRKGARAGGRQLGLPLPGEGACRTQPPSCPPAPVRAVVPNGVATGLDIGFSNYSLVYITLSFYVMCKSTTPLFLLVFAIAWGIEKPSWCVPRRTRLRCAQAWRGGWRPPRRRGTRRVLTCCPAPPRHPVQEPGGGGVGHLSRPAAAGVWGDQVPSGVCVCVRVCATSAVPKRVPGLRRRPLARLRGGSGRPWAPCGGPRFPAASPRHRPTTTAQPLSLHPSPAAPAVLQVGFILVMSAAMLAGLRWTITQVLLQGTSAGHGARHSSNRRRCRCRPLAAAAQPPCLPTRPHAAPPRAAPATSPASQATASTAGRWRCCIS